MFNTALTCAKGNSRCCGRPGGFVNNSGLSILFRTSIGIGGKESGVSWEAHLGRQWKVIGGHPCVHGRSNSYALTVDIQVVRVGGSRVVEWQINGVWKNRGCSASSNIPNQLLTSFHGSKQDPWNKLNYSYAICKVGEMRKAFLCKYWGIGDKNSYHRRH